MVDHTAESHASLRSSPPPGTIYPPAEGGLPTIRPNTRWQTQQKVTRWWEDATILSHGCRM